MYMLMSVSIDALNMSRKSDTFHSDLLQMIGGLRLCLQVLGFFLDSVGFSGAISFSTVNLKENSPFDFQDPSEHLWIKWGCPMEKYWL